MNRREFIVSSAATAAGALVAPAVRAGTSVRPDTAQPNILLLIADQMRGDAIGASGNRAILTPHMDRIAREGAIFRSAYAAVPSCTPARAGLLTGLSPWRHGMLGYGRMAPRYETEMPRMLREAGYYTSVIGKCHFYPQRNVHGFEHALLDESGRIESPDFRSDYRSWFWTYAPTLDPDATGIGWNDYRAAPYALPEELHPTRWAGLAAVNFLRGYREKRPFFLTVSFERPHSPYDPPKRLWDLYEKADLPKAPAGAWAERFKPRSGPGFDIWHGDLGAAQVRQSRQGYYACVSHVDEEIGKILAALEERGLTEDTLVVFISDHGDMLGDHYLWRKTYGYEGSAHIPMAMRWPSNFIAAKRGQVRHEPVELRDVLPTMLDAAGVTSPIKLDGRSLLDLVADRGPAWREYIDLEHEAIFSPKDNAVYSPEMGWCGLTDGKTKYIHYSWNGDEQLFDLESDPGEERDLSADPGSRKRLQEWRARLVAHLSERGERYVKNGKLQTRREIYTYSPNFPHADRPVEEDD